jgi:hypothetical protein
MQIAKHIEKNVPSPATKREEETKVIVSPENKNLSSVTFRDSKIGYQPCMSFMPPLEKELRRCEEPRPASFQETSADRMRDSVRRFRESLMYSVPSVVREQAVDTLNLLIRFDKAIGMEDAKVLMEAVKIINKAGVSHT